MSIFRRKETAAGPLTDKGRFWALNRQGSLVFTTRDDLVRLGYRPDTVFDWPAASFIVMIVCGLVDIAMFLQLFGAVLYDSAFFRIAATLVLFVGFDFGPVYLGLQVRRAHDGYRVNRAMECLFLAAFLLAFLTSAYLRYYARDIILPADSFSGSSEVNPLAVPWTVFGSAAPLITSLVSFAISYFTYHPLENEKKRLECAIARVKEELLQVRSILCEYEQEENYEEHLLLQEQGRYEQAVLSARDRGVYLCDLVRERLKEHLGEPSSTNELSKSACEKIMKDLEATSRAVREMTPPSVPVSLPETSSGSASVHRTAA
ncbi:MAG: hypothetical protein IJM26_06785 [Lachnospiraceae bacterium]|nr:hypothetical protein [Lachnospiraceae bacterium]